VGRELPLSLGGSSNPAGEPAAGTPSPSEQAARREQDGALERALERLSDDNRRVLLLRYREEQSFQEIAALLGRSANAVRKLWARALERRRQEMEGHR
jgi:RNA polymerase sigma factor (sigma-70 family)